MNALIAAIGLPVGFLMMILGLAYIVESIKPSGNWHREAVGLGFISAGYICLALSRLV